MIVLTNRGIHFSYIVINVSQLCTCRVACIEQGEADGVSQHADKATRKLSIRGGTRSKCS